MSIIVVDRNGRIVRSRNSYFDVVCGIPVLSVGVDTALSAVEIRD